MTLTLFLALSILGLDFLLYTLFQWTYGERRRKRARSHTTSQRNIRRHSVQNTSGIR
jgi:Flp pilus assembly protein TadB